MSSALTLPSDPLSTVYSAAIEVAPGFGLEAIEIRALLKELDLCAQKSVTLGKQSQLLDEVEALKSDCSEEGWDGYDAEPISEVAALSAMEFIRHLPDRIITPEVTPENTGGIAFDWSEGDDLILSVSILPPNIIYAGIVGSEKIHGESLFIGEIPDNVLKFLTDYFSRVD